MSELRAPQLRSVPKVSNRHRANLGDAVDLLARNFPEPKWLVPDLLPGGLAMLAGKPKSGKSWLALNWAVAIATGSETLGRRCPVRKVAYFSYESGVGFDTHGQKRLREVCEAMDVTLTEGQLQFLDLYDLEPGSRPVLGGKGADCLEDQIEGLFDDGCGLVIIDTLSAVQGAQTPEYRAEAQELRRLAEICRKHPDKAVLLVHHVTKGEIPSGEGIWDMAYGTQALTGTIEAQLMLIHGQAGGAARELHIRGRHFESGEPFGIELRDGLFVDLGSPVAAQLKGLRKEIWDLLSAHEAAPDRPLTTAAIKENFSGTEWTDDNVDTTLSRMVDAGQISRAGHGKYCLASAGRGL